MTYLAYQKNIKNARMAILNSKKYSRSHFFMHIVKLRQNHHTAHLYWFSFEIALNFFDRSSFGRRLEHCWLNIKQRHYLICMIHLKQLDVDIIYSRHTLSDTIFRAEKLRHSGYVSEISWHTLTDTCLQILCHFGKIKYNFSWSGTVFRPNVCH